MRKRLIIWTIVAIVVVASVLTVTLQKERHPYRVSDIETISKYKHRYLSVDEEATEAAARLLHHPDRDVRGEAITIISAAFLQNIPSAKKAVSGLIQISRSDPDSWTRSYAASVLARKGEKEGVKTLLEVATDSGVAERTRATALRGLRLAGPGARADDTTLGRIAHSLLSSTDESIRMEALYSLPFTHDTTEMKEFLESFVDHMVDPDSALLSAPSMIMDACPTRYDDFTMAYQMGLLGFARKEPDLVARLLGSRHEKVRFLAAQALAVVRDGRGTASLVELLRNSENWEIRREAIAVLSSVRDTTTIPALKEALKDDYIQEATSTAEHSCRPVAEAAYWALKSHFRIPEEELGENPAKDHPYHLDRRGRP
jgi:HEAT repeat protein